MTESLVRPVVDAQDLRFGYPSHAATLSGISLEVHRGESLAVMGASGAGKTTLLNVLGGLTQPLGGVVRVDGTEVSALSERRRAAWRLRTVGYVHQFGELLPELTVQENVALPLLLQGVRKSAALPRATGALGDVGMGDFRSRWTHELSGGQLQRVGIARALVHEPSLLLADEPTGSLDEATEASVLSLLLERAQRSGVALILVTHSTWVAGQCNRTVALDRGTLEPIG